MDYQLVLQSSSQAATFLAVQTTRICSPSRGKSGDSSKQRITLELLSAPRTAAPWKPPFRTRTPRASRRSAEWCLKGVDQCWSQKKRFIKADELEQARAAYDYARQVYRQLILESEAD
jgi:hypothetical protein